MGGHLLSSINPQASAEIKPVPQARRLPDVGELVIYHMRHGHARQGRTRFPAIVQGSANERGTTLSLTVILEAAELKNETLVQEIGAGGDNGHVWERPDNSALAEAFRGTITALHQRIGELEQENQSAAKAYADLRKMILGDYDAPKVALFEVFAKLEGRLQEVEQYLAPLKGLGDLTFAAPPVPTKGKGKRK